MGVVRRVCGGGTPVLLWIAVSRGLLIPLADGLVRAFDRDRPPALRTALANTMSIVDTDADLTLVVRTTSTWQDVTVAAARFDRAHLLRLWRRRTRISSGPSTRSPCTARGNRPGPISVTPPDIATFATPGPGHCRATSRCGCPAGLVGLAATYGLPATSSGLAAGSSPTRALLRASRELIERDAFTVTWLHGIPARQVPLPAELSDPVADLGGRVTAFDLPPAYSPHPVAAVAGTLPLQVGSDRRSGLPAARVRRTRCARHGWNDARARCSCRCGWPTTRTAG
ncbi:YcaO-like family protein [Actinocrispum sp. NPDC049592]|uniref:YcaO-like family protein n=1 Tax=Actinocrispum sp. NPDC049592 TaxID=3154835 RepID=UPI003443AB71